MGAPSQAVTLTPEQIAELNTKLADFRHNVNNHLSLIMTATELMRRKPELAARLLESLVEPPQRIQREVKSISDELQKALQITPL
jgi:hypothetical protein